MFRALGSLLFAILFLIIGIPVLGVEWLIGKVSKKTADLSSLRIVQWAFNVILTICGTDITVIGEENVPKDQPVLYIANHRSYFDIILTYARCPRPTGYISKNAMEKVPILPIWMRRLYCLFLDRDDPRQGMKTILTAIDYIKQGVSICIFPEGTRNKGSELMSFKAGSFKISTKTNCPIIPIALTNTADILEDHFPRVKRTSVVITYGEPIIPSELDPEDKKHIGTYVQNVIADMLVENNKIFDELQK